MKRLITEKTTSLHMKSGDIVKYVIGKENKDVKMILSAISDLEIAKKLTANSKFDDFPAREKWLFDAKDVLSKLLPKNEK